MTDKPLLRAVGQDPPPDPFDLDNLRLSQNFVDTVHRRARSLARAGRGVRLQDVIHRHQPAARRVSVAGATAGSGRPADGVVAFRAGGRGIGDRAVGAGKGQHQPWRLRNVRRYQRHERAGMAGGIVSGNRPVSVPRSFYHKPRSSGDQAPARTDVIPWWAGFARLS